MKGPSHLEGTGGARLELGDVGHLASHHRDPVITLFDARPDLIDQPLGPAKPAASSCSVAARCIDLSQSDCGARSGREVAYVAV